MELVPRTTAPSHATGAVEFVPLSAISAAAAFRLRDPGDLSALAGSIARLGQLTPIEIRPLPGAGDGPVRWQVVAGFRRLAAVRMLGRSRVLCRIHAALDEDDAWALALTQALMAEPLGDAALDALAARLAGTRHGLWAEELIAEARSRGAAPDDGGAAEDAATARAIEGHGEPFELEGESHQAAPDDATASAPATPADPAPARAAASPPPPDTRTAPAEAAEAGLGEAPEAVEAGPEDAPEAAGEDEEVTIEQLAEELPGRLWMVSRDVSLAVDAWDDLPEPLRRSIIEQARYLAELHPYLTRGRR